MEPVTYPISEVAFDPNHFLVVTEEGDGMIGEELDFPAT
jgi:hypothetical protein